jgi:hypothetical protein
MKSKKDKKIAIIGPFPPPYGGISVHLSRILTYVPDDIVSFFNISKKSTKGIKFHGIKKYIYIVSFFFTPYNIIHYHSTSKKVRFWLSIVSYVKANVYIHLHGESFFDTIEDKTLVSKFIKKLIPYTNYIASNKILYNKIKEFNPRSLYLYDAFIPPLFKNEQFLSFNNLWRLPSTKYKVSMVGWFTKYKNEDLYGFDIALYALKTLRFNMNKDVSFVASVNGIHDGNLYEQFLKKRKDFGLDDYFLLIEEELEEVYPLYINTEIFIRPTNTDGNSVSIKEAIWYSTPVIASDCVVRPSETILFKNRSANDLAEKILQVINKDKLLSFKEKIDICRSRTFKYSLIEDIYELEQ